MRYNNTSWLERKVSTHSNYVYLFKLFMAPRGWRIKTCWSSYSFSSTTSRLTLFVLFETSRQFAKGSQVPKRINSNHFEDPLSFHFVSLSGQNFKLSNTLNHDQITNRFPSVSAVLRVFCGFYSC